MCTFPFVSLKRCNQDWILLVCEAEKIKKFPELFLLHMCIYCLLTKTIMSQLWVRTWVETCMTCMKCIWPALDVEQKWRLEHSFKAQHFNCRWLRLAMNILMQSLTSEILWSIVYVHNLCFSWGIPGTVTSTITMFSSILNMLVLLTTMC